MSKINDKATVVIHGWMINRLGLEGDGLLIYALLYGATKNRFNVYIDIQYLESVIGYPFSFFRDSIFELLEAGLLEYESEEELRSFQIYEPRLKAIVPKGVLL